MHRQADIFWNNELAGRLGETDAGYRFRYDRAYLARGRPISLTLPLQPEAFEWSTLSPFFVGLLPEGWYLEIVSRTLKVDPNDRFGLLLRTCEDCIGAVSVRKASNV